MKNFLSLMLVISTILIPLRSLAADVICPQPFQLKGATYSINRYEGRDRYKIDITPPIITQQNYTWKIEDGEDEGRGAYIYWSDSWEKLEEKLAQLFNSAQFSTVFKYPFGVCDIASTQRKIDTNGFIYFQVAQDDSV